MGGIAINNNKYQTSPKYDISFIYVRKMQEIDKRKIISTRKKQIDENGNLLTDSKGKELFERKYTKIYQLDDADLNLLRDKCKRVIKFNW